MNKRPLKCLDNVQADEKLKDQTLAYVMNHSAKRFLPVRWVGFACLVVFLIVGLTQFKPVNAQPYTYIAMDINPSFELVLDKNDRVIQVNAYNQEANQIKDTLEVMGLYYQQALEQLMANATYQSYFKEGAFLEVSIYSKDETKAVEIEQKTCSYLDESELKNKYRCACVNEQVHNQAQTHQMSGGKYMLIEEIIEIDASRSFEELEGLSMSTLKQIYYELTGVDTRQHKNQKHHGGM